MSSQLTPAEHRTATLARLKAKHNLKSQAQAIKRAKESQAAPALVNRRVEQPRSSRDAVKGQTQVAVGAGAEVPLPRDSRLGKYFEYDLSKLHNSKGGFLTEDDVSTSGTKSLAQVEREKARERMMIKEGEEPAINPNESPRCEHCKSLEIEHQLFKVFGVLVCRRCKNEFPDKYSLLTKTECKEDYILTDPELKDEDLLPHLLKANPHASTYSNMMLYLRCQVEAVAFQKWGGPQGLDEEYERREGLKKQKRDAKFEQGLRELRRRTRANVWQKHNDAEHEHVWVEEEFDDGTTRRTCEECRYQMEIEML